MSDDIHAKYLGRIGFQLSRSETPSLESIKPFFSEFVNNFYSTDRDFGDKMKAVDIIIDKLHPQDRFAAARILDHSPTLAKNLYSMQKSLENIQHLPDEEQLEACKTVHTAASLLQTKSQGGNKGSDWHKEFVGEDTSTLNTSTEIRDKALELAVASIEKRPEETQFLDTITVLCFDLFLPEDIEKTLKAAALERILKTPQENRAHEIIEPGLIPYNKQAAIQHFSGQQKETLLNTATTSLAKEKDTLEIRTRIHNVADDDMELKHHLRRKIAAEIRIKNDYDTALKIASLVGLEINCSNAKDFGEDHKRHAEYFQKECYEIALDSIGGYDKDKQRGVYDGFIAHLTQNEKTIAETTFKALMETAKDRRDDAASEASLSEQIRSHVKNGELESVSDLILSIPDKADRRAELLVAFDLAHGDMKDAVMTLILEEDQTVPLSAGEFLNTYGEPLVEPA